MHALEWIAENARYRRTITSVKLRVGMRREKGRCTWCDAEVPKGRRRRSWCSEACRDEGYLRFGFWHDPVERRDKGVCVLCGFDSRACQKRLKGLMRRAKGDRSNRHHCYSASRIRKFCRRTRISITGQPYEIDHIIPVIEGGGCCGLDNLRTLCFVCHAEETKALAGRRAAKRRDRSRPLLT